MKKLPYLIFLLIFGVASFTSGPIVLGQSDAQISTIRTQYASINKRAPRYKRVKKQLSGFSLEGGTLTGYFDGSSIVKLVANHYGEMGRTLEEYYYSNGKLIFVFERVLHDSQPMGKVVRANEQRYYFNNDLLIRWIDAGGKQPDTTSEDSRTKQKELLEASNLFIAGVRGKNTTIER